MTKAFPALCLSSNAKSRLSFSAAGTVSQYLYSESPKVSSGEPPYPDLRKADHRLL
jgi:hypothetical protein